VTEGNKAKRGAAAKEFKVAEALQDRIVARNSPIWPTFAFRPTFQNPFQLFFAAFAAVFSDLPNSSPAVAERSLFVSSRLIFALHRWHLPIFHHWRDRAMDNDIVSEAECLICRYWPPAERADRRSQHFSKKGVLLIPRHDICPACERAFWEKITAAKH
jgi:hypothetical protein